MDNGESLDVQLPPFAPYPPPNFRKELMPEEWEACLNAWIVLAEYYLHLPGRIFVSRAEDDHSGLVNFVQTYTAGMSKALSVSNALQGSKGLSLRRLVFLLIHRLLSWDAVPVSLLQWTFLADFATIYHRSGSLQDLLSSLWKRRTRDLEESYDFARSTIVKDLDARNGDQAVSTIQRLMSVLHASPEVGAYLVTGSDLVDTVSMAYQNCSDGARKTLVAFIYLCLSTLCKEQTRNLSLFSDHIYSLKAFADKSGSSNSLLADMATNTPIERLIRDRMTPSDAGRARKLEAALKSYHNPSLAWPKIEHPQRIHKDKAKTSDCYGHNAANSIHVHRMSLVTQIQDLFPQLGSAFIIKLLDEYEDNVETVTAHVLEDSLPPHLQSLDRSEQLPTDQTSTADLVPHLVPRSTPSPPPMQGRRNIFDDDDLSNLTTDALSRLHLGRRDADQDADAVLRDRSNAPNKAAILSALAAFDSDDDERDDTYDVEDVGGTVDTTAAANADEAGDDKHEEALYHAWKLDAKVFGRDSATRRSKGRNALKEETGLTDEAIEGWGIMLARDPRRVRRLEARYGSWTGQQAQLERTAWRDDGEDDSGEGENSFRGGRGHGRGRGRGGFGGRGRGNVAGPASDTQTQRARHRKEANKGSRANHNRRDQRAKKMGRGGLPG